MSKNVTQAALSVLSRVLNPRLLVVQGLVGIFLCVNFLMIFTFFKKEAFRSNVRYIFFAHTLFCDTLFLAISDALLVVSFTRIPMPAGVCMIVYGFAGVLNFATPLTLTAMCVERYVAICMPLRHAEIATPRRATGCIFVIHALSSVMQVVIFSMVVSSAPAGFYAAPLDCSVEQLVAVRWQQDLRSALSQLYFLLMSITIAFTYFRIMAAARAASADDRKSSAKGLRTVLLHAFQLLLCLIMLWLPFIETAVLAVDFTVFLQLRYFDYVAFILAPRCLSPLVYGLRDEKFFQVLKSYALLRCCKTFPPTKIFSISEKS
ncbi:odorant receptor 131-2-like [Anguilla rostrata]|uniref:odorant receptor 131-2-like n=1 Tax=Anguilla rostrata TaxID=7938 RepID=UPI0030CCBF59